MTSPSIKEEFRGLQILHIALVIGLFLIALIIYWLQREMNPSFSIDLEPIEWVPFVLIIINSQMFRASQKRLGKLITESNSLDEKMQHYRAQCILQYALLEGVALISVVIFFLGNNLLLFILALLLGLILYFIRPTKEKFVRDLKLSAEEATSL